ncbi:hypothetical protein LCGC14_2969510 [marine sediment metagenome]|uniref:Uncharacterized protein n=1 Tax=marine sediment metagenome TaxID=412755 RepID=A0A0F8X9W0_9ZZZZ
MSELQNMTKAQLIKEVGDVSALLDEAQTLSIKAGQYRKEASALWEDKCLLIKQLKMVLRDAAAFGMYNE